MGAASVPEIYKVMQDGGYLFDAKNDANSQRGLHIAMGKNTNVFHRLPNGNYGLREVYPAVKDSRTKTAATNGEAEATVQKPLHEELQEEVAAEEKAAPKEQKHEKPAKAK